MSKSGNAGIRTVVGRLLGLFGALSRYDLLLLLIPLAFVLSLALGHVVPVSWRTALVAASLVSALAVADALFVHPPRNSGV